MRSKKLSAVMLILCLALNIVLVVALPVTIRASSETECTDFEDYLEWTATNYLPKGGNWVLTSDVQMKQSWVLDQDTNLCLNGHTVTFVKDQYWSGQSYAIIVKDGSELGLYDHTGTGMIVGDEKLPLMNVSNGTVNMYAGTLTGGKGGVELFNSTSIFNMYGGSITGNNGDSSGGVRVDGGSFNVSGTVVVSGNTANGAASNVRLNNNSVVNVIGVLESGTDIGISIPVPDSGDAVVVTSGIVGNGTDLNFSIDTDRMCFGQNADGEIVLGWPATVSYDPGTGSGSMLEITVADGSTHMLPVPSFTAPDGQNFAGWLVNGEGDPLDPFETITISGDTYLEATWKTESGTIVIGEHEHEWVFSINSDDRSYGTVKCVGTQLSSDDCNFREPGRWIKLDVSPTEKKYDGSSGFSTSVSKEAPNENNYWEGFPDSDLISVSSVKWLTQYGKPVTQPVDAGTYMAQITVMSVKNTSVRMYLRKNVVINKAPAPDLTVNGFTNLPLTDEAQALAAVSIENFSDYGTVFFRLGEDGEWTTDIPQAAETGEYTVYWYFESTNYENIGSADAPNSVTATISELHEHDGLRFTQWTDGSSLPQEAGNYFLTENVTLTQDWTVSNTINLCLNGKTISGEHQIRITNGGDLTLYSDEGGALYGLKGEGGGVLIERGGRLTERGVEMSALYGDAFPYNTTLVEDSNNAGAVTVLGTFLMYGGSITDSEGYRGGVMVDNGIFKIAGRVIITGNRMSDKTEDNVSNVYLVEGSVITMNGELVEESAIGVRTIYDSFAGRLPDEGEKITLTSSYPEFMGSVDPLQFFSHDYEPSYPEYILALDDTGELVLAQHGHNYVLSADDEQDVVTVKCINPFCEFGTDVEYTVSLTAEDAVFDNNSHEAVISNGLPDDMEIECYLQYEYSDGTLFEPDLTTSAPRDIGDYVAVLLVYPEGNYDAAVRVSKAFSIKEPEVPEAYVKAEPVEEVFYNNGKSVTIVNFKDWDPETIQYLVYWVDDGSPYYYWKDGTPMGASTPPQASSVGTHTVYYYIPEASDGSYKACGSEEEPLSVQATIKQKYTVTLDSGDGSGTMDSLVLFPETADGSCLCTLPESEFETPDSMLYFAGWMLSTTGEVKFPGEEIEVTGDLTLTAQWSLPYSIFINNSSEGGIVTASKIDNVVKGEKITLTVTPEAGYRLKSLTAHTSVDDVTITDLTFIMPDENVLVVPEFEKVTPEFKTYSLLLSGQIGVVVYMDLPAAEGVSYEDSYMEFTVSGKDGQTVTVPYSQARMNEAGTYYGFTCYINAIQMADTITAVFHYGDNETLEWSGSAMTYLNNAAQGSYGEEVTALCASIADYGYYAQQYLSEIREWELGTDHAAMPSGTEYTTEDYESAKSGVNTYGIQCDPVSGGIKGLSYSLVLDSETSIKIYVTPEADYTGTITAYVGEGTENAAVKTSSGRYEISISGIPAHRLGEMYTVSVTAEDTFDIRVFGLSYVKTVLNGNSPETSSQNMMTAFYRYYESAMAYKAYVEA